MKRGILALLLFVTVAVAQNPVPFPTNQSDNGDSQVQAIQKLLNVTTRSNAIDVSASKSDTVDLPHVVNAIYVGGTGSVKVDMAGTGSPQTFTAIPTGTTLVVTAKRVYATGTTATLLIGLY